jgi:hypothetical protein
MTPLSAGGVAPAADAPELDAIECARAMRVPPTSVRRWLRVWHAAGVPGIRTVPSRGRYGVRYIVHPEVPARWLRGEMPDPRTLTARPAD